MAGDLLGTRAGHLLDLDPALGREHDERAAASPVEHDRQVELARDLGRLGHQHLAHRQALDRERQDPRRLLVRLLGRVRELDPARLAAAAHQDLRLDDHRAADARGDVARLLGARRHLPRQHRQPVAREQLLGLVLVEVHDPASATLSIWARCSRPLKST